MPLFIIFIGILTAAGIGAGLYVFFRHLQGKMLRRSLDVALFLIQVPKETREAGERDLKSDIGRFEQLLSGLSTMREPFTFEVAVPHVGEEIHFYLAVSKKFAEVAVKQVQGLWNGARVELAPHDYNIFNPEGAVAGAFLALKEHFSVPTRTYAEVGADTFAGILGGFTKVNEVGEGAALQLVVRPDGGSKKTIQEKIAALRKGEPLEKVLGKRFPVGAGDIAAAFKGKENEKEKPQKIMEEDAIKTLEAKISKQLFAVNIRLLASAGTPMQATSILDGLAAGFGQLAAPRRNEFKLVKPRNPKKLIYHFVFRQFDPGQAVILSSEEIASFYHLPIATTETPRVKWLKAKEAPPPSNLPKSGLLIGEGVFRGERRPIYITDDDRRRHVYLVGQTGTGKSTLLGNMIISDIQAGKGVAVIDPHGDLVEAVLGHIPESRRDDLIYFDPSDMWRPVGLNMLDYDPDRPEEKTFIVNEMQGIFNKLFPPETMGPMFEQYMRNALLLLMEDQAHEPATLIEVPRVFTDPEYRRRKLQRIRNPVVVDFWEKEAAKAGGEASLTNMTPYITSKFNNFIANDYIRPIIGQPKSAFHFRKLMDEGKILLVNLSKGRIGDINANLLGMILTGKLLMAALSRVDTPDVEQRRDFYLYIDEFQNFTTDSIGIILSEARKYRLNLVIAHQFVAQLTEKVRDAVFGNVGSQIVFRVGIQDAEFLVKQFEPIFDKNDLVNIDNFYAYVKILVNNETTKPFNIHTLPMPAGNRQSAHELKEHSRSTYGADRQVVEEAVYRRLRG